MENNPVTPCCWDPTCKSKTSQTFQAKSQTFPSCSPVTLFRKHEPERQRQKSIQQIRKRILVQTIVSPTVKSHVHCIALRYAATRVEYQAAAMGTGAGEFTAATLGAPLCISTSTPALLVSLLTWLAPSLFSLLLSSAEAVAESSALAASGFALGGALQREISQTTPVKLLRVKLLLPHFLQGLPLRSSARRPALMAPMLALGPSLWAPRPAPRPVSTGVPSSLLIY
jgi:hypothetical protein